MTSKKSAPSSDGADFLEVPPRFELGNEGFADLCLTTWLWHRIGAGDEARTRYLHLGKVALYQMSYTRVVVGANCAHSVFARDLTVLAKTAYRFVAPPPQIATACAGLRFGWALRVLSNKLRSLRFRLRPYGLGKNFVSLRCSPSPNRNRFAGSRFGWALRALLSKLRSLRFRLRPYGLGENFVSLRCSSSPNRNRLRRVAIWLGASRLLSKVRSATFPPPARGLW